MPTYTTQADFEAYVEGWVTDNPAALDRLLERAERDVDSVIGYSATRNQTTGLKLNPAELETWRAAALSRAVCAQAEYRNKMGEDFMVRAQHGAVSGPDFSTSGRLPYIGPKVLIELEGTSLAQRTTTVGSGSMRPPWYDFAYNDTSWDYDPPPRPTQS